MKQQGVLTGKQEEVAERLIECYREQGRMSYAELDRVLPLDFQTTEQLDQVLLRLEAGGVELCEKVPPANERDARLHRKAAAEALIRSDDLDGRDLQDHVRMYLSQMGSIPLLTRNEEIMLAKTIEVMNRGFRRKVDQRLRH